MLLGKYLNKYYIKFLWLYLLGIASLVVLDYVQLYVPEYLGDIVDYLSNGETEPVYDICLKILFIAFVIFLGRMIWRFTLFNAS